MNSDRAFTGPYTVEDDDTIASRDSRSSGASGFTHEGPATFADLVDLTGLTKCRVVMSRNNRRRVCGHDLGSCPRKKHSILSRDASRRAEPGWYLMCPGTGGVLDGDGRERVWTTEEARALQDQELLEQAAALRDLGDPDQSFGKDIQAHASSLAEFGDPDESLGTSFHVAFQEEDTADELLTAASRTPGIKNTKPPSKSPPKSPPRASAQPTEGAATSSEDPGKESAPPKQTWYGLEHSTTGDRVAIQDEDRARALSTMGWVVRRIFESKVDADVWVAQATRSAHVNPPPVPPPPPPRAAAPTPTPAGTPTPLPGPSPVTSGQPRPFFGLEHPKYGERTIARNRADADVLTESGFVIKKLFYDLEVAEKWVSKASGPSLCPPTASNLHVRKTGPDKSTTIQEVFKVNINKFDEVDAMMLPSDTPVEMADEYYDCATDVLALPGGYRSLDQDDEATDDSVAIAMLAMMKGQQQTSLHVRYGAVKYNGLSQVKTGDDLAEFMEDLHETYDNAEEGMTSQLTRKMHSAGHSMESIEDYLQNGVLPRVVRDTYRFYCLFLTTLAGYISKASPNETWGDSIGKLLLKHHRDQLALIRETSASYRDLVLRNYAYLRQQSATSFWNDKLSKKAALHTNRIAAGIGSSKSGSTGTSSEGTGDKCSTCFRKHEGRSPCPTTPLTKSECTKLGKNLGQRKYEKALKSLKQAFASNPNVDHDEAIERARQVAED